MSDGGEFVSAAALQDAGPRLIQMDLFSEAECVFVRLCECGRCCSVEHEGLYVRDTVALDCVGV